MEISESVEKPGDGEGHGPRGGKPTSVNHLLAFGVLFTSATATGDILGEFAQRGDEQGGWSRASGR